MRRCPADAMPAGEREVWTEKMLAWLCKGDTPEALRLACGRALAGISISG